MSIRVFWSDLAKANLKEIYAYYKEVAGIKVANSIKSRIKRKPRLLSENPEMGQVEDNTLPANGNHIRIIFLSSSRLLHKIRDR
jgi:plasmid stabilization system protein ParE